MEDNNYEEDKKEVYCKKCGAKCENGYCTLCNTNNNSKLKDIGEIILKAIENS